MTWIALLILAIVQGATEFLPISSSGHLRLGHAVLGTGEPDLLLDIVLHAGTLLAVLWVYRRDVLYVLRGTGRGVARLRRDGWTAAMTEDGFAFAVFVCAGSVVTAFVGLLLKDLVEGVLGAPSWVGTMLLLNGAILWSIRWRHTKVEDDSCVATGLSIPKALLLGLLQGLAVTPGISRSGLTITGAMWLDVPATHAARFSFLLSVPAILGALALKLFETGGASSSSAAQLIVGLVVAGVVGAVCLRALVQLLKRARFHHFAWYCWVLGAAAVAWAVATS